MWKYKHPINCVVCNKQLDSLYDQSYDMVDGGIIAQIRAPYGSIFDGNTYQIGICDECVERVNLKQIDGN